MTLAPNAEQLAAIDESGVVFVSAGAGTGKTTVLVERFVRAVVDGHAWVRRCLAHSGRQTQGRIPADIVYGTRKVKPG